MIIPPFTDTGLLPPGVHPATLAEIDARFGTPSELRRAQMDSVRWMIDLARRAGAIRIILNGSFTTDTIEPNDVDCVLLAAPEFPHDRLALKELRDGLPFLQISIVRQKAFDKLVHEFFATDRFQSPKGMVEVIP